MAKPLKSFPNMTEAEQRAEERRRLIKKWIEQGLTQRDMAKRLGVTQQTVNRFMKSRRMKTKYTTNQEKRD